MRFQITIPTIYEIPDEDVAKVVAQFRKNWAPHKPELYVADLVRCASDMGIGFLDDVDSEDLFGCESEDTLNDEDYPE